MIAAMPPVDKIASAPPPLSTQLSSGALHTAIASAAAVATAGASSALVATSTSTSTTSAVSTTGAQGTLPKVPRRHNERNCIEFLGMINNRLKIYLGTLLVDDLNVPLSILADYMSKCRTRVMASRVVTVSVCVRS
jgi:hypothetical protein